jgi:hypothetical protein
MIALTPDEANEMRGNNKIAAIKLVRSRTFMGLREAKEYVERWDGKTILDENTAQVIQKEAGTRLSLMAAIHEYDAGRINAENAIEVIRRIIGV